MNSIFIRDFSIKMGRGVDIKDITDIVNKAVTESQVKEGVAHLTSIGSTGSITTIEYEPGAIEDLKRAINELAPPH
ncbi:MAG: YjbQ family protein, partial [Deltaproteobacteria bacterium]